MISIAPDFLHVPISWWPFGSLLRTCGITSVATTKPACASFKNLTREYVCIHSRNGKRSMVNRQMLAQVTAW